MLTDFMEGLRHRHSKVVVLEGLKLASGLYDPHVLAALEQVLEVSPQAGGGSSGQTDVPLRSLMPGMCLVEDLCTPDGALVLAAGTRLAQIHLERLRSVASIARLVDTVLVEG